MEKVQAGLRRSQLKMHICGAWVFLEPGTRRERCRLKVREKGYGSYKGLPER